MVESEELEGEMRTTFRSATMRLAYLAQDRPELQFCSKEIARQMQAPTHDSWQALKRAVRFVVGMPRVVARYVRQKPTRFVNAYSDSDHAGCLRTRRSTSSSVIMLGSHFVKSTSTTQTVVAMSTGESEFYSIVKTSAMAIGMVALARDYGVELFPRVFADATAGKGIAQRRGAGKIRHIHTPALWVQGAIADRRLTIHKWPGERNPADLGNKHLDGPKIRQFMEMMGCYAAAGRSSLALRAAVSRPEAA